MPQFEQFLSPWTWTKCSFSKLEIIQGPLRNCRRQYLCEGSVAYQKGPTYWTVSRSGVAKSERTLCNLYAVLHSCRIVLDCYIVRDYLTFSGFFSMKSIFAVTNKPTYYWLWVLLCASNYNKFFLLCSVLAGGTLNFTHGSIFFFLPGGLVNPQISAWTSRPIVLWAKASALWNVLTWVAGTMQDRTRQESKGADSHRHSKLLFPGLPMCWMLGRVPMSISLLFLLKLSIKV